MSEAKHTDGEWSVLEHEGEVFVLADGAMQVAAVTYVIEHAREVGSRRLQNARLMAAAPALLSALQALLDETTTPDEVWADGSPTVRARAAIAKATWSQP